MIQDIMFNDPTKRPRTYYSFSSVCNRKLFCVYDRELRIRQQRVTFFLGELCVQKYFGNFNPKTA